MFSSWLVLVSNILEKILGTKNGQSCKKIPFMWYSCSVYEALKKYSSTQMLRKERRNLEDRKSDTGEL